MKSKDRCVFAFLLIFCHYCQSKETLFIGGLFGLDTILGGWNSAGIIPAVQMAIDHINNSSQYLRDYHLELLIKDSKVCQKFSEKTHSNTLFYCSVLTMTYKDKLLLFLVDAFFFFIHNHFYVT